MDTVGLLLETQTEEVVTGRQSGRQQMMYCELLCLCNLVSIDYLSTSIDADIFMHTNTLI